MLTDKTRSFEAETETINNRYIETLIFLKNATHISGACECRLRTAELFVVTPHVECIADDGIRLSKPTIDELQRFTDVMFSLLQQLSIPHHIVSILDRRQRVEQVVQVIRNKKPSIMKTA